MGPARPLWGKYANGIPMFKKIAPEFEQLEE